MTEPLGTGKDGKPVWIGDIWPTSDEIHALMKYATDSEDLPAPVRRSRRATTRCGTT